MIESEKIAYARKRPCKPRIYRNPDPEDMPWVVEAAPVMIYTRSWDRAIRALCELYKYGVNR